MKRVLITGAAGQIARHLREGFAGKYRLRLLDIAPVADPGEGEEALQADLTDFEALRRAMEGVDAVVHLGAVSVEDSWEMILPNNIAGTYNVFEAARLAGVKRALFASSNHAVGFYRRDQVIGTDVTLRPDSRYGVSKAFGEALAALYADKYGLAAFCMRIGNVLPRPVDERRLAIWLSPRDFVQLVELGLELPDLHFEVVYGVSDNDRSWWDNANAERLGYRPQDNSEAFAAEVLAAEPPHEPGDPQHLYQGGAFVGIETGGDPTKVRP